MRTEQSGGQNSQVDRTDRRTEQTGGQKRQADRRDRRIEQTGGQNRLADKNKRILDNKRDKNIEYGLHGEVGSLYKFLQIFPFCTVM